MNCPRALLLVSVLLAASCSSRSDTDPDGPPDGHVEPEDTRPAAGTLSITASPVPVTLASVGSSNASSPAAEDAWYGRPESREFQNSVTRGGSSASARLKYERTGNQVRITADTQAASPANGEGATATALLALDLCYEGGRGGGMRVTIQCDGTAGHADWGLASVSVERPGRSHCFTVDDYNQQVPWEHRDGKVIEVQDTCVRDLQVSINATADDANAGTASANATILFTVERL
ncbi:MAG: hypothetical protein ACK4N5_11310 [Myxococcales bacterium]